MRSPFMLRSDNRDVQAIEQLGASFRRILLRQSELLADVKQAIEGRDVDVEGDF